MTAGIKDSLGNILQWGSVMGTFNLTWIQLYIIGKMEEKQPKTQRIH